MASSTVLKACRGVVEKGLRRHVGGGMVVRRGREFVHVEELNWRDAWGVQRVDWTVTLRACRMGVIDGREAMLVGLQSSIFQFPAVNSFVAPRMIIPDMRTRLTEFCGHLARDLGVQWLLSMMSLHFQLRSKLIIHNHIQPSCFIILSELVMPEKQREAVHVEWDTPAKAELRGAKKLIERLKLPISDRKLFKTMEFARSTGQQTLDADSAHRHHH